MDLVKMGRWSFIIGLILAVLAGFTTIPGTTAILLLLGIIVGFLNISEKETSTFLLAVITLLLIGLAGLQFGTYTQAVTSVFNNFLSFVSAAALVVAVKQVLQISKV